MSGRVWAALGVGVLFCATFALVGNVFVGAACGAMAAVMTLFVLGDAD